MKFDIIERNKITSVMVFLKDLNLLKKEYERKKKKIAKLWYRGLPDGQYKLLPSIARPQEYNGKTKKFVLMIKNLGGIPGTHHLIPIH